MAMAFLASFLLFAPAALVVGQPGFISIYCGSNSSFTDSSTNITYVPDGPYIDTGESNTGFYDGESNQSFSLRSFPSGKCNCYSLPTVAGSRYLMRATFLYGNYDGKNSSSLLFDLHLGASHWITIVPDRRVEAIFVAWATWTPVCLVNIGSGTPFITLLELRPLDAALYPSVTQDLFISLFHRGNMGANDSVIRRYPDDPYDRLWFPMTRQYWANMSTTSAIKPDPSFAVPVLILQTAAAPTGNNTILSISLVPLQTDWSSQPFVMFLHFADFQNYQLRQFGVYINGNRSGPTLYSPLYLTDSCLYTDPFRPDNGNININLAKTATSVLPPMMNAYEIYSLHPVSSQTFPKDFDAIMAIKLEYGVKKNWTGDPCYPTQYAWVGLACNTTRDNKTRITSMDLSYNKLSGSIPDSLLSLPSLRVLNLIGNQLSGDSLCKNYTGSLIVRYDANPDACDNTISASKKKAAVIAISVVVPVLVLALFLAYFILQGKRKPTVSTHDPTEDPQSEGALGRRGSHVEHIQNTENRLFTYQELEKFTENFKHFIGKGGFGSVYHGHLEDNTEVAIKILAESSSHGLDEFLAEVRSLTKVHHRNLVSLIGYCWDKDHLALVYEFMSQGSLFDHIRGQRSASGSFNWGTRMKAVLEAAQGLDYLHKGCNLPIVHRDVKTNNILLGQNLQAKLADFGLSQIYVSDTQTHVSATAAGTPGYMDPEYYRTGRLTESSDVYSFGVVLLEVVTGEAPLVPGQGHIVQRVKQKIATGVISSIADPQLGGAYDLSSMWKVIETAMMCTEDFAAGRPTMAAVMVQLKESLALEEAREKESISWASRGSDIPAMASTFRRPSAR